MALTFSQREQLWIQGGGNPAFAAIAAAISTAENGAGTLGPNPDTGCEETGNCAGGCYAVGLWQIECSNVANLIQQGVISSVADLSDPIKNAAAAVFISGNGKNWNPWSTFNPQNGKPPAYLQYLNGNAPAPSSGPLQGTAVPPGNPPSSPS